LTQYHLVYGLRIKASHPIPGLEPSSEETRADLKVLLGRMPDWLEGSLTSAQNWRTSVVPDDGSLPGLHTWLLNEGRYFRMVYSDGTAFVVDRSGKTVWASWPDTLTLEDTATYLLGPVFGFLLRLRGVTCLHASAIAVGDQAIVLLGPAGAGKSTTAGAFAKLGCPVLSEDVVALDDQGDRFLAQPGYPIIRLWSESVDALYGAPDALPLLTPNWDKRYLDLIGKGYPFQQRPLPVAAIYILDERRDDPAAPLIEVVAPQAGLVTLVANAYTNYLLAHEMRAREFDLLGRLVKTVPLRRITPHSDIKRLPDLCQMILDDFDSLNQAK